MADIYSFPEWRKVDEEVKRPDVITSEENRDLNEEMLKMVKALSAIDEDGDYDGDCIPESIEAIMQGIEEYFWLKRDYYASMYLCLYMARILWGFTSGLAGTSGRASLLTSFPAPRSDHNEEAA